MRSGARALGLWLLLFFVIAAPATSRAVDTDGDGVDDTVDVCLNYHDPLQGDFDSNGFGDFCECGDLDGDLAATASDLSDYRNALLTGTPLSSSSLPGLSCLDSALARCNFWGAPGVCDIADVAALLRHLNGQGPGPTRACEEFDDTTDNDCDGYVEEPGVSGPYDCNDLDPNRHSEALVGTLGAPATFGECYDERVTKVPPIHPDTFSNGCSAPFPSDDANDNPTNFLLSGQCPDAAFANDPLVSGLPKRGCDLHDACYAQPGLTKEQCDDIFRVHLNSICDSLPVGQYATCNVPCGLIAEIYYLAVKHAVFVDFVAEAGPICTQLASPPFNLAIDCNMWLPLLGAAQFAYWNDQILGSTCCPPYDNRNATCGDATCDAPFEQCTSYSCPQDCGACGIGEDCFVDGDCASNMCPFDGQCSIGPCGDGTCSPGLGETCLFEDCQADCGACPNGIPCDEDLDCASGNCLGFICAPPDICGDLSCTGNEDCASCPIDCGLCCTPPGFSCSSDGECCSNDCLPFIDVCAP